MKELKFGLSPLTNEIYAGYANKKGDEWTEKQDVTIQVLLCTVQYCLKFGSPIYIRKENGEPKFEIAVKDLRNDKD